MGADDSQTLVRAPGTMWKWGERIVRAREVEDPGESTKQSSWGLAETEEAIMEPAWVCTRSSPYVMWLFRFLWDS